ncbi:MAG TPA: metallopeptidase TldD-related protein [bacterium]|nr:metallopeptidase TldD-related protein [bacterium]
MRSARLMVLCLAAAIVAASAAWPTLAGEDDIFAAMQAELQRSRERLSLPGYEKPYFIAYRLTEEDSFRALATLGALLNEGGGVERKLYVEVRVGDYDFDNSSTIDELESFDPEIDVADYLSYIDAPIEDDVDALRARLWRVTDLRFKNASAAYLNKKARAVYREEQDGPQSDFTREEPVQHIDADPGVMVERARWSAAAKKASAIFKEFPEIISSQVYVQAFKTTQYLINTEGARVKTIDFLFLFGAQAEALADDGMTVEHFYTKYARTSAGLPAEDELLTGVRRLAEELLALRRAPVLGPYTGPAILDPSVAGTFFHEAIGHRLEGDRTRSNQEGQTFKGKIGHQVLPEFINVIDDPTQTSAGGVELNGHYLIDDEGVRARPTELITHGKLVGWLQSRMPVKGFSHSNGHGRASAARAPMSRMGTMIVHADRTVPVASLKERLMREARAQNKPYGVWLRHGMGGETSTQQYNFQAFSSRPILLVRVDANTGAEELVRGAEMVGTPLLSVSKVIAAGDDVGVFNGYCGAESGYVPVSSVAPSLLVREIELQRVSDQPTRAPILPPPYAR